MNILKIKYQLWKKAQMERKQVAVKRHLTKSFYRKMDEAIEMCKTHPRKYYIVQKSEAEWEILGSQELRKMRKFKDAKKDETFMTLHETAPHVSPENIGRLTHEQSRRKNRWWFLFSENYYKPVTKAELETLKSIEFTLRLTGHLGKARILSTLILKHEG